MAYTCGKQKTPRYKIPFQNVPNFHVDYPHSQKPIQWFADRYAKILDCVYEMAQMVMDANADRAECVIKMVLKDEGWTITPTHFAQIKEKLEAE